MIEPQTALTDTDRIRSFIIATIASMIVIGAGFGLIAYALAPEHDAVATFAIGGFVGFWVAPLGGGVVGNGYHEWRLDRARAEAARAIGQPDDDVSPNPQAA